MQSHWLYFVLALGALAAILTVVLTRDSGEIIQNNKVPYVSNEPKVAVMIEPRKHHAIRFVVENIAEQLPEEWKIQIFHGTHNEEYVNFECLELIESGRVSLVNMGIKNFNSGAEYSAYMMERTFWDKVDGEHVLIFQTDSIINKETDFNINDYLMYDFIGGPQLWNGWNGGFSLRKKSTSLEVVDAPRVSDSHDEDVFFSQSFQRMKGYRLPDEEVAKTFCVDFMYQDNPFAFHKVWTARTETWEQLRDKYPDLKKLHSLQSSDPLSEF